jgi:hypothetical protein
MCAELRSQLVWSGVLVSYGAPDQTILLEDAQVVAYGAIIDPQGKGQLVGVVGGNSQQLKDPDPAGAPSRPREEIPQEGPISRVQCVVPNRK